MQILIAQLPDGQVETVNSTDAWHVKPHNWLAISILRTDLRGQACKKLGDFYWLRHGWLLAIGLASGAPATHRYDLHMNETPLSALTCWKPASLSFCLTA
ncbi:hypothetical protein CCL15_06460 [Pseudomonas syringae]|nr:hypothetical protein CCL15_06460 [Pseudomonas syringae]